MIESWIYIWQQSYRLCWRTGYEVREKNSKVPGLISWKERAAIYRDGVDCGRGFGVRELNLAYINVGIPISHAKTCYVETNWEMAKVLGQIVWDLKRSRAQSQSYCKKNLWSRRMEERKKGAMNMDKQVERHPQLPGSRCAWVPGSLLGQCQSPLLNLQQELVSSADSCFPMDTGVPNSYNMLCLLFNLASLTEAWK